MLQNADVASTFMHASTLCSLLPTSDRLQQYEDTSNLFANQRHKNTFKHQVTPICLATIMCVPRFQMDVTTLFSTTMSKVYFTFAQTIRFTHRIQMWISKAIPPMTFPSADSVMFNVGVQQVMCRLQYTWMQMSFQTIVAVV